MRHTEQLYVDSDMRIFFLSKKYIHFSKLITLLFVTLEQSSPEQRHFSILDRSENIKGLSYGVCV